MKIDMDTSSKLPEMPLMDKAAVPGKSEELIFHPTPEPLLGVEIELQILDRDTYDLAPGAVRILKVCEEESVEGTSAELMQSMIEVKTGVCESVDQVRDQLFSRVKRVRNIASSLGYQLAMAGTHPFHRASTSTVFPAERYERIFDRLAWLTYQRVVFGLHVHIGMPNGDMAIGVINLMVQYLPHLIALSASSPFWEGVDTGLASSRIALYRLLPRAGIPPHFSNWKGFRGYYKVMTDCHSLSSLKDIYWDIRPRPDFGTIEVRVCDIPLTLTETLRLVALIHCLTISCLHLLEEHPGVRRGDIRRRWIAVENKWLATRHGLQAIYIRTPGGKRRPLASDLSQLIERLLPIARESGDERFLISFKPVDKIETGADRQRQRYRETGNWKTLLEDMAGQLSQDLERANSGKQ
jgi:glutamate---cysteine ligase / carboxylate-amine ligase